MEKQPINYDIIAKLIPSGVRVLDLGCGDGTLLKKLIDEKNASGVGVEISQGAAISAIEKGLSILQGDIDNGLAQFLDKTFDYAILNQTLQSTEKPDYVIDEMLRVARKTVVSFPNFGYWKIRAYLFFRGKMPKSRTLPYEWYDTPNIHLLTIGDFKNFCKSREIKILQAVHISESGKFKIFPHFANWLSPEVVFVIER
jgi:methionine biosynthesis protein MetW